MAGSNDLDGGLRSPEAERLSATEFPPPSATLTADFGACSRRGHGRVINEDHYLVIRLGRNQETVLTSLPDDVVTSRFDEYGHAMIVADGMGGAGTGEMASRLALVTLVHLVRHFGKWNLRIDNRVAGEIMDRAERFYRHIDLRVLAEAHDDDGHAPQTTLTAIFGAGRDLFFAHVGHSRAYLLREGHLLRLTRDHTIGRRHLSVVPVAPLVDVNVAAKDLMHVLNNTLGMGGPSGPRIDIERFRLLNHDRVLVCTNGLTDILDEDAIGAVLASRATPSEQCTTLVDDAIAKGSGDDVTAVVAHYHVPNELPTVG